jgi:nitroreductase
MNILDLLTSRRSIKSYTNQEVTKLQVEHLLQASMHAPSAGNQQPWHFLVLRNKDLFEQVVLFHPHAKMLPTANVAILVCGDMAMENKADYWMIDCAAATQNMLIAAHGMDLGAVWLGIYPREERIEGIRALYKLPENIVPFSLVSIGYPAEEKPIPADRFNTERIHFERW